MFADKATTKIKTGSDLPATKNNEWKYLIRVILIGVVIIFLIYKIWFGWWISVDAATVDVKEESSIGKLLKAENGATYVVVDETMIVDADTLDVLQCEGEIRTENCRHTNINCGNIGLLDLRVNVKENLSRCNKLEQSQFDKFNNPDTPPVCVLPMRLYFTPTTKTYECK